MLNLIKRNLKYMIGGFSIGSIGALLILFTFFSAPKVEATGYHNPPNFNICNVFPWLPICEEEEEPEDVCQNLDGIQESTPEGYVNEQGYCYIPEPEEDYCPGLEGVQKSDEDCPEVTPTPSEEPGQPGNPPTFAGSSTEPPVCPDGNTINLPANPHVLRAGESATVNFFLTEGDSANIYWRVVGQKDWQHSVADVKPNSDNFVSYTIHNLDANLGYDFGVQQKKGCGGGQLVTAVVVDGPQPQLFHFSYWEWSK